MGPVNLRAETEAEAIDRAGRGDSRAVIISSPAEPGSATWRWECADTLLERC